MLINAGSVGQSRVRGGFANWGVLNTDNRSFMHRQTPFDSGDLIKEARLRDPDLPYLWKILERQPERE